MYKKYYMLPEHNTSCHKLDIYRNISGKWYYSSRSVALLTGLSYAALKDEAKRLTNYVVFLNSRFILWKSTALGILLRKYPGNTINNYLNAKFRVQFVRYIYEAHELKQLPTFDIDGIKIRFYGIRRGIFAAFSDVKKAARFNIKSKSLTRQYSIIMPGVITSASFQYDLLFPVMLSGLISSALILKGCDARKVSEVIMQINLHALSLMSKGKESVCGI